jgi:arylsulfatase A-like enzyme
VNHGHGHTLYAEQLTVPLIFKLPGRHGASTRSGNPVSLIDIAPTLVSIAGARTTDEFEGRNLLTPDGDLLDTRERILFAEAVLYPPEQKAAIHGSDKLIAQRWPPSPSATVGFDLTSDRAERSPEIVEGPSSRYWSLFEALASRETPEASGERVEVDPILTQQLEALGYAQ